MPSYTFQGLVLHRASMQPREMKRVVLTSTSSINLAPKKNVVLCPLEIQVFKIPTLPLKVEGAVAQCLGSVLNPDISRTVVQETIKIPEPHQLINILPLEHAKMEPIKSSLDKDRTEHNGRQSAGRKLNAPFFSVSWSGTFWWPSTLP